VKIPITNIFAGGDYTGQIMVGPEQKPMNVLLDTGSSALALDERKYAPDFARGDTSTDLAQTDTYGDGSVGWTGSVIKSTITVGSGANIAELSNGNVSVAYKVSDRMFDGYDGILGLAYAPLDDAFQMPQDTSQHHYTDVEVRAGNPNLMVPYLTQLSDAGITTDKMSFYTHRSFVHVGGDVANDPLNNGLMILGGGEESTDLYTGSFQTVKVLSDDWYSTKLKEVVVGNSSPVAARLQGPIGMPSNSIVDSGTNSLSISPQMLSAIISKFSPDQQLLLNKSIYDEQDPLVPMSKLRLDEWPTISFVMEGDMGDVKLDVTPSNYWQVNTQNVGFAAAAITVGPPDLAILGLPLMNGYFTIFDGEADGGKGVIKFATKAPIETP